MAKEQFNAPQKQSPDRISGIHPKAEEIELSEADFIEDEGDEEIELSSEDLIEEPPTSGTIRHAEFRTIESREAGSELLIGAATEASLEHPDRNEDAYYTSPKRGLQFVADGMGGVPAGDFASAKAAEQLTRDNLQMLDAKYAHALGADRTEPLSQSDVEGAVDAVLRRMNAEVEKLGEENETVKAKAKEYFIKELGAYDEANPQHKNTMNMLLKTVGCTASLTKIWRNENNKDFITVGNIGDSRTYILRGGKLEKLTRDDSHVEILIEEGVTDVNGEIIREKDEKGNPIDIDIARQVEKSKIIALADKRPELRPLIPSLAKMPGTTVSIDTIRNKITQAIGLETMNKKVYGNEFKPFVKTVELHDGDVIFTGSDGVCDNLTDTEIQAILNEYKDNPLAAAHELQKASTQRTILGKEANVRAKKDDVTALVSVFKKNK